MEDQLVSRDLLLLDRGFIELFCQVGTFAMGQHPADNRATADVEDHVQVVVRPLFRSLRSVILMPPKRQQDSNFAECNLRNKILIALPQFLLQPFILSFETGEFLGWGEFAFAA